MRIRAARCLRLRIRRINAPATQLSAFYKRSLRIAVIVLLNSHSHCSVALVDAVVVVVVALNVHVIKRVWHA